MEIEFKNVSKSFGKKNILNNLNFTVYESEIFFIIGRSGTGKSVTLKSIIGLIKPDKGKILINSEEIQSLNEIHLTRIRKNCGMVFQHPALLDSLTIYENLSLALTVHSNIETSTIHELIKKIFLEVHLNMNILEKKPSELSYGMQKRVSIARSLMLQPKFLLFDEPTTGLDPITTTAIHELISDLSKHLKTTIIVVSHDLKNALKYAHRILVLDEAKIAACGSPTEIMNSTNSTILELLRDTKNDY